MDTKEILNLQGIKQTLMFPLWGRAVFSRLYPEILYDKEAVDIVNSLEYDFSEIKKAFGEYGGLCYVIRARKIDDTIKHFILEHPNATVVNIGAGLDTTFSRVDNGTIRWYDIDLSDVIALRKKLIPKNDRSICIAKSVFDYTWFKDICFDAKDGILFIAGGVFFFFAEDKIKELLITLAENFPNGELYFDGQTKMALKISNKMVKKTGNKEALMYFYINNPKIFASWSPLLYLKSTEPYFKNIKRDKRWKISTKINMIFCDLLKMVSFYHIKFKDKYVA
ncbi:MAG: class I SAM-dependent methyltransferase [Campylobacteraceae bacterium]|jgi:O-methyltransferase involved in polyketide biosynthesis|nr:class I SAM-dependent methyltransferase [Campylobacteraceae bacterium]